MKKRTYKPIKRKYYDYNTSTFREAYFIAQGQWDNGYLAYTMCDKNGNPLNENELTAYYQTKSYVLGCMVMLHI